MEVIMNDLKLGKFLSLILRHNPQCIGLELDINGWADVNMLIDLINKNRGIDLNFEKLCEIVSNDNKMRYSFNHDKTQIRANQGHSISVDVELKSQTPPDILYHGTAKKFEYDIDKLGLLPMNRLYTHLSSDIQTAHNVGKRHGEPLIYEVDCKSMLADGYIFYISENNVWLTHNVPNKFLKKLGVTL